MNRLTTTQQRILESLHDYRFLTVEQMQRLGIAKNEHTIYKAIRVLRGSEADKSLAYVDYTEFGTLPTIGRLPRIHYLTKRGAKLLAEALQLDQSNINYPKGVKIFSRDYFHRVQTIDLHILARLFCEAHQGVEFDYFQAYFEHQGANHWGDPQQPKREALNKITINEERAFIPDCIFKITDPNNKPFLFTGEIYRNYNTKRTHQQLYNHLLALEQGTLSQLYHFPRAVPVLVLCEQKGAMQALQKRLNNDPSFQKTEEYFLFRCYADIIGCNTTRETLQNSFALGWETYTGKKRGLFR